MTTIDAPAISANVEGRKIKIIGLDIFDTNRFQAETVSGKPVFVSPRYKATVKLKLWNSYITVEDIPLSSDLEEVSPEARMEALYETIQYLRDAVFYLENQVTN